jgi:hypothetical protein
VRPASLRERALLAAFLIVVFATGLTAIADGDIFWHLAAGRLMAQTGRLLRADPFSTSALGRPWVDVHWLFQLGAYGLFRAGGLLALVLARATLLAAGAAVLWRVVERESPRLRLPFALALGTALFLGRHLLPVRPTLVTLLFLAVFFWALERHRREHQPRVLIALPLLQVVWVNVQGLAVLGPAIVAAYLVGALATAAAGDRRWFPFEPERASWRPLALALGACLAASFITPFGASGALLPLRLLPRITPGASVFAAQVAENIPPFVLERTAPEQIFHFKWYLAALALSFAVARRLWLSRLLVLGGLVALALMANRNVALLYWLGTALGVMNLAPALERLAARRRATLIAGVLGVGGLVAVGGLTALAAAHEPSLREPTPFRFPTEAARRLAALPGGGSIFAPDHQGGYLIWSLHPRYRPFLDTRLILHTSDEFSDYLALLDHPERFADFQARHRFDYVVLPTGYPDRYLGLVAELARSPDWTLLFTDGSEVLFARDTPAPEVDLGTRATTLALLDGLRARYRGPLLAAARLHLAKLDLLLGHLAEAQVILAAMDDRDARALRARAYLLGGDLATAETLARSLLASDAGDVEGMNLLALVALARGDTPGGVAWLRRALERAPYDSGARALLDRLERR